MRRTQSETERRYQLIRSVPCWKFSGVTKLGLSIAIVAVACLLPTGCQRPPARTQLNIEHDVTPRPIRVGQATVHLRLLDKMGRPVVGASIHMQGDMTHAGMSPAIADATEVAPGLYSGQLNLSMAGDWVVISHITLRSGETMVDQFDLRGVQSK